MEKFQNLQSFSTVATTLRLLEKPHLEWFKSKVLRLKKLLWTLKNSLLKFTRTKH